MFKLKTQTMSALALAVAWGLFAHVGNASERSDGAALAPMTVQAMQYLGDGQGWVSDGQRVLFTHDEGRTWRDVTPAQLQGNIGKVHFASGSVGWIVTADVARAGLVEVRSTINGGQSWSVPTAIPVATGGAAPQVLSLSFADMKAGRLLVQCVDENGVAVTHLYATNDGGSIWQAAPANEALSLRDQDWNGGLLWKSASIVAAPQAEPTSNTRNALADQLTADEEVIDAQRDAAGHGWAVVLGGFCEAESGCIQYSRLWTLGSKGTPADITPRVLDPFIPSALPSVSMASAVVQAHVEPVAGNRASLSSDSDVERVQSALVAKGISTTVDGWYGNGTTSAYSTWQRRLGYNGLDANGIPGPSSLAALGQNRFVVTNKITVGSRTTFTGKTVNQRTRSMLLAAQRLLGRSLYLTQGSYNPGGVGASAHTHDGGGAVDVSVSGLSQTQIWNTVRALRRVGFAAWYRPRTSSWGPHIHGIAVSDTDVHLQARDQVADYYLGRNGLAGHGADNTPSAYRVAFTWWEKYSAR